MGQGFRGGTPALCIGRNNNLPVKRPKSRNEHNCDGLRQTEPDIHVTVQVDGLPARHFFDGAARQLRVELGDIAPGQTKTVTFTAAVNSNAYGKRFGNTAVISAKNGGPVTPALFEQKYMAPDFGSLERFGKALYEE